MLGCYPGTFGFRGVSGGAGTARVAVLHHQMVKQAATPSMQSRQCRCGPVSANQPHRSAVPNNLTMPEAKVANEAARIGRRDRTSSSFFKESRQQKLTLLSARGRVFFSGARRKQGPRLLPSCLQHNNGDVATGSTLNTTNL